MLKFLNLGRFMRTDSIIIRQPSVLARDLSGSSWLDQADGRSDRGSKGNESGKNIGSHSSSGDKRTKSSSSVGKGKRSFGSKMKSPAGGSGFNVRNEKRSNRFIMDLGNNQVARIDYKSIGRNKIELYYTEVPSELRGRGIGKALAKGALEQAARNKMRVKLSCSYLVNNLDKFADAKLKKILEK